MAKRRSNQRCALHSRRCLLQILMLAASGGSVLADDVPSPTATAPHPNSGTTWHKFSKQVAGYVDRRETRTPRHAACVTISSIRTNASWSRDPSTPLLAGAIMVRQLADPDRSSTPIREGGTRFQSPSGDQHDPRRAVALVPAIVVTAMRPRES